MKNYIKNFVEKHTKIEKVTITGIDHRGKNISEELDVVRIDSWLARVVNRIFFVRKYKTVTSTSFI